MKHFKTYLAAMALALSGCQSATDSCETTELWYAQPAKVWMESLPIGNGRLGAMTYGGIEEEKLALNECGPASTMRTRTNLSDGRK